MCKEILEKLFSVVMEEIEYPYIQEYSGAISECKYCFSQQGRKHEDDCLVVEVNKLKDLYGKTNNT